MSIVKVTGGLGNQLFQYSFGQFLHKNTGMEVFYYFDTVNNSRSFTNRDHELSKFNLDFAIADQEAFSKYKIKNGLLGRFKRKITQLLPFISDTYVVQQGPHDYPSKFQDAHYDGYWQIYEYPETIKEKLQTHLQLGAEQLIKFKELINNFESENSVALHIRRSDYITIPANAKIFNVCDKKYYEDAIAIINSRVDDAKYYIFTEDMDWAKENFVGTDFVFVEGNSAIEDMLLMAKCKHNIIANSTFSWWSAWLNQNPEKMVVTPKKWYKGPLNETVINLIPEQWNRI